MKASELRIGNWVNFYDDGSTKIETALQIHLDHNHYEPIPLTEEWLLKFGFSNMEDKNVIIYCRGLGNFDGEDYEDAICITQDKKGDWYTSLNRKVILRNVHQFQNLVHALTGHELKTKQDDK